MDKFETPKKSGLDLRLEVQPVRRPRIGSTISLQATLCQKSNLSRGCTSFVENTVFMQVFLNHQPADYECQLGRSTSRPFAIVHLHI